MAHNSIEQFKIIIQEFEKLKNKSLNKDDLRFQIWHKKTREAIIQFVPKKLPAFDEIPFASDFFLSKPKTKREDINDRIALVSDCELTEKILEEVILFLKREEEKYQQNILKTKIADHDLNKSHPRYLEFNLQDLDTYWSKLDHLLETGKFTDREKMEVRETMKNLQTSLSSPNPDWDQLKRGIKFLLDFESMLALEFVPFLLLLFKSKQNPTH